MCTAATYATKNHYFGRNLDYEFSYGEEVVVIPRHFAFDLRNGHTLNPHYAITGIAYVVDNMPLLYDAINEKGLGMAGLNFVGNAVYNAPSKDGSKDDIAQFEFLPWILGQCSNIAEARTLLAKINLTNVAFSEKLPPSDLHWMLSDTTGACIVVESVADGLKIYDNPAGVLTNNPPFPEQLFRLNDYLHLSAANPANTFNPEIPLQTYSRGMGGLGLPGDLSSGSRFVKAAFTRAHSISADDELSSVSQFFHILHSVDQQNGCCDLGDNKYEHTLYSSCYNLEEGIFYYTTYNNHQITAITLSKADIESAELFHVPVIETEQINYLN